MFKIFMNAVLDGIEPQNRNARANNAARPKAKTYKTPADIFCRISASIKSGGFRKDPKITYASNNGHLSCTGNMNDHEFSMLVEKLVKMRTRKGGFDIECASKTIGSQIPHDLLKTNAIRYPAIAAASVLILGIFFRPILITGAFVAIAVLSRMYQKHIRLQLGVDLAVFGTVICGALFGPIYGAIVGLAAYPISIVYTKEEARYLPVAMAGIALVGVVAGSVNIAPRDIVMWGVGLTALYDILTSGLYYHIYRAPIIGGIVFSATHIAFNYFVFSSFGEFVLNILA